MMMYQLCADVTCICCLCYQMQRHQQLSHIRFVSRARVRASTRMVPHSLSRLRRGRRFGRKLAPLALCPNTYTVLKRFSDGAYADMEDETKDELIGALCAMGAYVRAVYDVALLPMHCPDLSKQDTPLTRRPRESACEAVPLLLSHEPIADLDFGASPGETPSAVVSPPLPPAQQRKIAYMEQGLNVKKKVKSTVVKTTPPTTVIASTPKSTTVQSGKAEQPQLGARPGFKIPMNRRLSSVSSDGCESAMSSLTGDAPGQRRKGLPSQGRRRRQTPVGVGKSAFPPMPNECSSESARPIEYDSLINVLDGIRRDVSELKGRQNAFESEWRREHHEVRHGWSSRGGGRPSYPEGQSRGRRDRGVADSRWR